MLTDEQTSTMKERIDLKRDDYRQEFDARIESLRQLDLNFSLRSLRKINF